MFCGTFKFDNFHFNYHIEANLINFSPFSRFKLGIPGVHYSVHPNVDLSTVIINSVNLTHINIKTNMLLVHWQNCSRTPIAQSSFTILIPTQCIYSLKCPQYVSIGLQACFYIQWRIQEFHNRGAWSGAGRSLGVWGLVLCPLYTKPMFFVAVENKVHILNILWWLQFNYINLLPKKLDSRIFTKWMGLSDFQLYACHAVKIEK